MVSAEEIWKNGNVEHGRLEKATPAARENKRDLQTVRNLGEGEAPGERLDALSVCSHGVGLFLI